MKISRPDTNGYISGKAALHEWWAGSFEQLPGLHYELRSLTADENAVFIEYTRKLPGEADILVAEVLDIKEKIVASRVYHG